MAYGDSYSGDGGIWDEDGDRPGQPPLPRRRPGARNPAVFEACPELRDRGSYYTELRAAVIREFRLDTWT